MPTDLAPASEGPGLELAIDSLGQEGDGVARQRGAPVRVRYALGGETVLARTVGRNRAVADRILSPSPLRVVPPCPLFGRCGGCVLQHLDREAGLAWKAGLVQAALRAAEPLVMRAAQKGILHKNTASRKISRLTARVKALAK